MIKNTILLSVLLLFSFGTADEINAQEECKTKVIVVPLSRAVCPDGQSECDSSCIDTKNNPDYCGDCETACDDFSYCSNGSCTTLLCITDADCSTGGCVNNACTHSKRVFISSATYNGNLGGISGADNKCQGLATAAALSGTYKAWLSDNTSNPNEMFNHSDDPYVLVDGTIIATDWDDLVDGALLNPIYRDEKGVLGAPPGILVHIGVWTNTKYNGIEKSPPNTCSGWSSSDSSLMAPIGDFTSTVDFRWSYMGSVYCNNILRLYCFEQ